MQRIRRDPFRDLAAIQERVNRLFEGTLDRIIDEGLSSGTWSPAVDIYETEDEIIVKAELPEVNIDEMDIRVEDNALIIKGERRFLRGTKEENYHRIERAYGNFSRSFLLPNTVYQEGIKASYKDGVLKITMPKRHDIRPRQITIEAKE